MRDTVAVLYHRATFMCVKPEALLSALVALARDGREVTRRDLETLLAAGVSREALANGFRGTRYEALVAEVLTAA